MTTSCSPIGAPSTGAIHPTARCSRNSVPPASAVAETQALLNPDEALVAILVGSAKTFLWAVTRERTGWAQVDFGNEEMAKEVLALRNALDPLAQQDAEGAAGSRAGVVQGFDLE